MNNNYCYNKSIEDIEFELWKKIPEFNLYLASNFGRIKRLNGYVRNSKLPRDFIVAQFKDRKGYLRAAMRKNDKLLTVQVHRIISLAFIPNPENKPQVNHINGIKDDNIIENLEWNTAKENLDHAFKTGLRIPSRGEKHISSKISDYHVKIIRRLYRINPKFNRKIVAKKFNVSKATIYNIIFNITKKHLL